MTRAVQLILTVGAALSLALFAGVSCLRAANFGDRATPPPPGYYAMLTATGIVMFVSALVGLTALVTARPRRAARGVLLLGVAAVLFLGTVPLLSPPEDLVRFGGVLIWELLFLSPIVLLAIFYLVTSRPNERRAEGGNR